MFVLAPHRRRLTLVCLALLAGCASRTEVIIGVATDLKAKGQLDKATFTALRDGAAIIEHSWDLTDIPAGNYELPGSFGIYSPDGSEPRVELQVQGFMNGQLVVARDSVLSLVANETLFTRMAMVSDCNALDGPNCSATQTCIEGVCRDKAVDAHTFPPYSAPLVTHVACQSGSQFIVSSSGMAMPLLPGTTGCGANQYCQEGTCYNVARGQDAAVATGLWVDQMSPLTDVLHAVWQTPDGQDVFAVGDAGTILHLHGGATNTASTWVKEPSGTPPTLATLTSVWGTSVDDVWAAGTLYGSPVSAVPPPPLASAILLHRSTGAWTIVSPAVPGATLRAVTGTGPTDVWAVGLTLGAPSPSASPVAAPGAAIFHFDGAVWTQDSTLAQAATTAGVSTGELLGVYAASPTDVTVVGQFGLVAQFDGSTFTPHTIAPTSGAVVTLHGVIGTSPGDLTIVGGAGLIARLHGGVVTFESSGISGDLFAVAALSPTELVAVGDFGVILRGTRVTTGGVTTWRTERSGTNVPLFAISGGALTGANSLLQWVVGRNGTIRAQSVQLAGVDGGIIDAALPDLAPPATCTIALGCPSACSGALLTSRSCTSGQCVDAPTPAPCANNLNCAADSASCLSACTLDSDCQGGFFCGGDAACHPRIAQANPCDATNHGTAVDCSQPGSCGGCGTSLFCTDGVCCDESPTQCGGCSACAAKTGTCAPVLANNDPHGACTAATGACQQTTCDGQGSCANTGNSCGTNACNLANNQLTTNTCQKGTCTPNAALPCPNAATCKNATMCNGGCAQDSDCVSTSYCGGDAACHPRKAIGVACNLTDHPASGACLSPGGCGGCDISGPQLYCTDGVCCSSSAAACTGCKMCAPPADPNKGTCINVPATQDPHNTCTAGTCLSASCNGAGNCNAADGLQCATMCNPNAAQSTLTTTKCLTGACTSMSTANCPVVKSITCANATSCIASCAGDTDCATGYFCAHDGTCKAQIGAANGGSPGVSCMNLVTNPINGNAGDCKQDKCRECKSGNCVDGYCCDTSCTGQCVACDVANVEGQCSSLPTEAPHTTSAPQPVPPRSSCPGSNPACGPGACEGTTSTCNFWPSGPCNPTCTPAAMSYLGATAFNQFCNSGACSGQAFSADCYPYTICSGQTCATSCTKDSDCAANPSTGGPGYYCNTAGKCVTELTAAGAPCGATPCFGGGTACRVCGLDTCIADAVGGGTCCKTSTCGAYSCQASGSCNGRCSQSGDNTPCALGRTCAVPTCK